MALEPCRECGKEVSTGADACPHCGAARYSDERKRSDKFRQYGCFAWLGLLGLLFFVCNLPDDQRAPGPRSATGGSSQPSCTLEIGRECTTNPGYAVCLTVDGLRRAIELSSDRAAYARFIEDEANGCAVLQGGTRMVFEGRPRIGIVKLRLPGETASVHTVSEAIR